MVLRRKNEKLNPKNLVGTVKYGGGGIIVWWCMSASGLGDDGRRRVGRKGLWPSVVLPALLTSPLPDSLRPRSCFCRSSDGGNASRLVWDHRAAEKRNAVKKFGHGLLLSRIRSLQRESIVIVKKFELEILTNLHVLDLPKSEKRNFGIMSVCEHDNSKTIRAG
ncbi:hypothetical protein AVEN_29978-1 [Araneus ventricosus]|uniref:Uncharacterized protein n=1 Tax=Araneus ventricosus TaxID=182803 RepID=A0A4Y2SL77_ARAVE|nr:hypothetical protein AVEN_110062-1 [Araneus ventricosus]GBN89053.1 hypothetical protein AVEN_29978-1 [Araneus ventricosus]